MYCERLNALLSCNWHHSGVKVSLFLIMRLFMMPLKTLKSIIPFIWNIWLSEHIKIIFNVLTWCLHVQKKFVIQRNRRQWLIDSWKTWNHNIFNWGAESHFWKGTNDLSTKWCKPAGYTERQAHYSYWPCSFPGTFLNIFIFIWLQKCLGQSTIVHLFSALDTIYLKCHH